MFWNQLPGLMRKINWHSEKVRILICVNFPILNGLVSYLTNYWTFMFYMIPVVWIVGGWFYWKLIHEDRKADRELFEKFNS